MGDKFYLTTAIDYVNSKPHLGTAYEKIAADVIARYKRMQGKDVFFLMGTDEHSLNVERQARLLHQEPKEYCDEMVKVFKDTWQALNLSFDSFIRTTDKNHIDTVQYIVEALHKRGDVYKGWYKGWYCVSCEAFLKEKDLVNGACPTHGKPPQWIEEENYYFRLSLYGERLLNHIEQNPDFIKPEIRKNEIVNVIKGGLEDISISRASAGWGIPVPFDAKQVIYVWVDALINYVSGAGFSDNKERFNRYWPCNLHLIGKDITRFHCIIWPSMLMGSGIPLPLTVFGHGFVNLAGEKMSKTLGTVVDPLEIVKKFGPDPIRYFLLREVAMDRDGDFTWEKFISRYNADLANDLGNLLNRVLNMAHKYTGGLMYKNAIPDTGVYFDLKKTALIVINEYRDCMETYRLDEALASAWNLISRANRYVEETSPWKLNKEGRTEEVRCVLYSLVESIRISALLIEPFMPETAKRISVQLGMENLFKSKVFNELSAWGVTADGHKTGIPESLFPKIET